MVAMVSGLTLQGRRRRSSVTVASRAGLLRVLEPHVNVCRWRRHVGVEMLRGLEALVASAEPRIERAHGGSAASLVASVLPSAPPALASWLSVDIMKVREAFERLVPGGKTVAQLELVTTDKCRRFHADYKTLRAVCTYVGPGTQWVDDIKVDRVALEQRCEVTPMDLQNERIVKDLGAVQQGREAEVIVLRGDGYQGRHGAGAVHRSPPIEALGLRRLVLTLDYV